MPSRISLTLTPEQQVLLRSAIGMDAEAIELRVEELEDRIVPTRAPGGPVPIPYPNTG